MPVLASIFSLFKTIPTNILYILKGFVSRCCSYLFEEGFWKCFVGEIYDIFHSRARHALEAQFQQVAIPLRPRSLTT